MTVQLSLLFVQDFELLEHLSKLFFTNIIRDDIPNK